MTEFDVYFSPLMTAKSQLIDETTVRRHLHDWLNDEKLMPKMGALTAISVKRKQQNLSLI